MTENNKKNKKLAYYQIISSGLLTAGSVLVASWFVVVTGDIVHNKSWFFLHGAGMLSVGIALLILGIAIPILGIGKLYK